MFEDEKILHAESLIQDSFRWEPFRKRKMNLMYLSKRFPKTDKKSLKFRMIKKIYVKQEDYKYHYRFGFVSDHDKKPYFVFANENLVTKPMANFLNNFHSNKKIIKVTPNYREILTPVVLDISVDMVSASRGYPKSTMDDPELTILNVSNDFTPFEQKDVAVGYWKRSSGVVVAINDKKTMNDYHLMNALKKSVRQKANRSKYFELKAEVIARGLTPR